MSQEPTTAYPTDRAATDDRRNVLGWRSTSWSRRRALGTLAAGLGIGVAGCLGTDSTVHDERIDRRIDGEWRMEHGTRTNTRAFEATGPGSEPAVAWRQSVSPAISGMADPIVTDGLVFEPAPAEDDRVAIETATGEWSAVPNIDSSQEAVIGADDDGIYVVRYSRGEDFTVRANRTDGTNQRWERQVQGWGLPKCSISSDSLWLSLTEGEGPVHSIATAGGEKRWQIDVPPQLTDSVAVGEDIVAVPASPYLFVYDRSTRERRWYREFEADLTTQPIVTSAGILQGTESGTVQVFNDGTQTATIDPSGASVWALAAVGERAIVGTDDGVTVADATTGEQVATIDDPSSGSQVTVGTDRIYVADNESEALIAIDRVDFEVVWRFSLPETPLGGPVLIDDTVIVRAVPTGEDADGNSELLALQ
ncbi:MAG: PQQ-binding-like beta-propeller repeat protein [Halapricum sp.]